MSPSIVFYANTSNVAISLYNKVSVSLKRHTFLRINSRNQPFIYLQSKDILGFDYEKIFNSNIILNFQLGNQCEKVYLNAFGGFNYIP